MLTMRWETGTAPLNAKYCNIICVKYCGGIFLCSVVYETSASRHTKYNWWINHANQGGDSFSSAKNGGSDIYCFCKSYSPT